MSNDNSDQRWVGLAVGLSAFSALAAISLVGVLLVYLLRRRDDQLAGPPMQQLPQSVQPFWINMGQDPTGRAVPTAPALLNRADSSMNAQQPLMHTYALTSLLDSAEPAVRLIQASYTAYDVTLSVVGPSGAYAAFAMDQGELLTGEAVPTGNVIILPTCSDRTIRLLPKQTIYAKGVAAKPGETVFATATAHEVGSRVYNDLTR